MYHNLKTTTGIYCNISDCEYNTSRFIFSLDSSSNHESELFLSCIDWQQGYGYQIWRGRHNSFHANGMHGQYIIILPDQNTVIVMTSHIDDYQGQLDLVWEHLLPALK